MLIHKTMKMPTSCLSCWISPTCDAWVREKSKHKGYDNRLENCPLEEVKHGHWDNKIIEFDVPHTVARCSNCKGKIWVYAENYEVKYPYCPLCGAKMDEVEE